MPSLSESVCDVGDGPSVFHKASFKSLVVEQFLSVPDPLHNYPPHKFINDAPSPLLCHYAGSSLLQGGLCSLWDRLPVHSKLFGDSNERGALHLILIASARLYLCYVCACIHKRFKFFSVRARKHNTLLWRHHYPVTGTCKLLLKNSLKLSSRS